MNADGVGWQTWTLWEGDRLLAQLAVTENDWPWLYATVAAEPDLEVWRPQFDQERRLIERDDDVDEWEAAYAPIADALTLLQPDGRPVEHFILHIEGATAWWRWA